MELGELAAGVLSEVDARVGGGIEELLLEGGRKRGIACFRRRGRRGEGGEDCTEEGCDGERGCARFHGRAGLPFMIRREPNQAIFAYWGDSRAE